MQALSLTSPGVEQLAGEEAKTVARETNAAIGEAVRRWPDRFFGLASLPLLDPQAAIAELEQAIAADGCKGVVINGHLRGRYLDDRTFWPVLARAEALNLPIYLHPTQSPEPVVGAWYGGLKPAVAEMMANGGWGWHIETALHVLRMVLGGVFDVHPELQVVIGHMGETLPFMIERVEFDAPGRHRAQKAGQRIPARKRPLHFCRLQFPADLPPTPGRGRRRPHYVLGRSSLSADGGGARLSGRVAGRPDRPGEDRARQCGAAVRGVARNAVGWRYKGSTVSLHAAANAFALASTTLAVMPGL